MVEKGDFLEWAEVLGNYYGTERPDLKRLGFRRDGSDLGYRYSGSPEGSSRGGAMPLRSSSFPLPRKPFRERLVRRGLDAPEVIQRRLANAKKEIEEAHRYHYVILNEETGGGGGDPEGHYLAERCQERETFNLRKKNKGMGGLSWQESRLKTV